MTRALFCWELGDGFGHLFRLAPIGQELVNRGCQVAYGIPDVIHGVACLRNHASKILRAPIWQTPPNVHPLSQTYSQNLLRNGYWHKESLHRQLRGWFTLFDVCQPDVILAEHAPTVLLAARKSGTPCIATGTGFSLPPLTTPMPGLQPWFTLPERYLIKCEKEFLSCVNPTLQDLGIPALTAVADLFEGAVQMLCTFPELDHYGARPDTRYWGPVVYTPQDKEATWPSGKRDNVFLYIKPEHRFFRQIIYLLKEMGLPTLVFAPGLDHEEQRALQGENLSISSHPVNLKTAATHCRLMISEGGHNTGVLMLLTGVPLFICPGQLEQAVWAHRVSEQGLCMTTGFFDPTADLKTRLEAMLSAGGVEDRTRSFAAKYAAFDPAKQVAEIAGQCLALSRTQGQGFPAPSKQNNVTEYLI